MKKIIIKLIALNILSLLNLSLKQFIYYFKLFGFECWYTILYKKAYEQNEYCVLL